MERPEYNKVIELVKKREINHVVVWAIDRWTRRGPQELKNSISYLTLHNVSFHAVKEQWIESINMPGSMGQVIRDFMFGMLAWLAEAESQRRSERVKASEKYQKALDKKLVGRGSLPEEVVKEVIEKLEKGMSYRKIHEQVTYKAKYGKVKHISIGKVSDIAKKRKQ